jgi:HD-GYP domain-containing protein (c-di-GMP phosphodiesterase class II)
MPLAGKNPATVAECARTALSEQGAGFAVTASCGWAVLPKEADSASEALGLVDQRMYAEKANRTMRGTTQMQEIFRRIFKQHDPYLKEHFDEVARLAMAVGVELGLGYEEIDVIGRAAEFHDIGKVAIPQEILDRPGPLSESEWDLMRRHTMIGYKILNATPAMRPVATLVRSSHERWDGRGYPDGLVGEMAPLGARIVSICDAFDAMTSKRPYSEALSRREALAELRACAGTQFDPDLVEVFCAIEGRAPIEPAPAGSLN